MIRRVTTTLLMLVAIGFLAIAIGALVWFVAAVFGMSMLLFSHSVRQEISGSEIRLVDAPTYIAFPERLSRTKPSLSILLQLGHDDWDSRPPYTHIYLADGTSVEITSVLVSASGERYEHLGASFMLHSESGTQYVSMAYADTIPRGEQIVGIELSASPDIDVKQIVWSDWSGFK